MPGTSHQVTSKAEFAEQAEVKDKELTELRALAETQNNLLKAAEAKCAVDKDEIDSSSKALKRSVRVIDHHSQQLSKAQEKLLQAQAMYSALIDKTHQNTLISRNLGTKKVMKEQVDAAKAQLEEEKQERSKAAQDLETALNKLNTLNMHSELLEKVPVFSKEGWGTATSAYNPNLVLTYMKMLGLGLHASQTEKVADIWVEFARPDLADRSFPKQHSAGRYCQSMMRVSNTVAAMDIVEQSTAVTAPSMTMGLDETSDPRMMSRGALRMSFKTPAGEVKMPAVGGAFPQQDKTAVKSGEAVWEELQLALQYLTEFNEFMVKEGHEDAAVPQTDANSFRTVIGSLKALMGDHANGATALANWVNTKRSEMCKATPGHRALEIIMCWNHKRMNLQLLSLEGEQRYVLKHIKNNATDAVAWPHQEAEEEEKAQYWSVPNRVYTTRKET